MKNIIYCFIILFLLPLNLFGQTPISSVNATYDDITDTSDDYTAAGITYRFNRGTENNLILNSVEVGGTDTFQSVRLADRIILQRVDNAEVSGNKQLMFYENFAEPTDGVDLKPGFSNTMEEVLLNQVINRGTDNVFGNDLDGSGNDNNIERIDFIFDNGIVVPPDNTDEGFILLERGGNDDFKIAAITSLDSQGEPAAYNTVLSVANSVWSSGTSPFSIITDVMSSPTLNDDLQRTTQVGAQEINGIFISYSDLGLSGGDLFFGYSLAGGDVSTTATDWLDITVSANFPTNTSSQSSSAGGLDLVAGGSFSSSNLVEGSYTLTGGECWRMLSSPVPTTYANLLNGLWTQGTSGADFTGGPPNVLIWPTNQSGTDPNNWVTPNSLTDPLPAGAGVLVSVYADDNFDGTVDASENFDKTINVSGTGYEGNISPTLNTNSDGWTLVGNPYNFPIDFGSASLTKTNINNVAYVYDRNLTSPSPPAGQDVNGNSGGWRTTDGSYGDLVSGIIEPFQGFFIQNNGTSPVFTFSESAKDVSGSGSFYGKEKGAPENVVRFEMNGEGLFNSAWITVSQYGDLERTNSDALELLPFSDDYLLFGTNKGDDLFDIGHFPFMENGEIALETETTQPGNYTITATDFEVNPELKLIFVDTEENVQIPVDQNFSYKFEINEAINKAQKFVGSSLACGSIERVQQQFTPKAAKVNKDKSGRFYLKVTGGESASSSVIPESYNLRQNYPNPFNPITQITYELPQQSNVLLEVFDMNGRQVATLVNESVSAGTHTVNFDASSLSSGVYLYKLQTGSTILTRKLTLIK